MLRELLETKVGQPISDAEFKEVMQMTADDIKFNNIGFSRKTKSEKMLIIATRCAIALRRCS